MRYGSLALFGVALFLASILGCSGHTSSVLGEPGTPDGGVAPADAEARHDVSAHPADAKTSSHPDAAAGCPPETIECSGRCVFSATDESNCGECGNICGAGLVCAKGVCGCPTSQAFCSGACIDIDSDPNNCGACGHACRSGVPCGGGSCGCGAPTTLCGASCVDESTDDQNCGTCGNICSSGLSCVNGACGCPAGDIYCAPTTTTPGICTDIKTDPSNCGGCTNVCPTGEACVNGACACPVGQIYCAAEGICASIDTDPSNCGGCGASCPTGEACVDRECVCGAGQTDCPTIGCVDLSTDPRHCGTTCPGSTCGAPLTCQSAACACPVAGQTYCRASNTCTDTSSDPDNCGACGTSCGGGTCAGGVCTTAPCILGLGTCAAPYTCLANDECGCDPSTPQYCPVSNTCVDLLTDPANCGVCGNTCPGTSCAAGVCTNMPECTLLNNASCTPGAAAPSCCEVTSPGATCGSTEVMFGTYTTLPTLQDLCCVPSGGACDTTSVTACCGYMACTATEFGTAGTCACQENGHHCVNNADCCDNDCTAAGICGQSCVASGVSCQLNDICCVTGTTTPGTACGSTDACP